MRSRIEFTAEAAEDYKKLDGSIKKEANKKIDELAKNPLLGEQLGNKFGVDLSGFYKLYIAKKKFWIVYRLITPTKIEIIEIWGIGKRDKADIYKLIGKRLGDRLQQ